MIIYNLGTFVTVKTTLCLSCLQFIFSLHELTEIKLVIQSNKIKPITQNIFFAKVIGVGLALEKLSSQDNFGLYYFSKWNTKGTLGGKINIPKSF